MAPLKRLWGRLSGWRTYVASALLSAPDILEGLIGFDWSSVLPDAWAGYGAKIGGALAIVRLVIVPAIRRAHRKARRKRRLPDARLADACQDEDA